MYTVSCPIKQRFLAMAAKTVWISREDCVVLYSVHYILYTIHCVLYTVNYMLNTVLSILYTVHYIIYTIHCVLYTVNYILNTVLSILYTVHNTLYNIHYTLCTIHCKLYIEHCIKYTIYSTQYAIHYTQSVQYREDFNQDFSRLQNQDFHKSYIFYRSNLGSVVQGFTRHTVQYVKNIVEIVYCTM